MPNTIAQAEARAAASTMINRPTVVLTPRGQAVCAAYKLLAALRALGAEDRRDILELLALEVAETVA